MRFSENRKISLRQLKAMLILFFCSTGTLFLPAELAEAGGKGAWLLCLLWGVIASLAGLLLVILGQKKPFFTAVEWYKYAFGKTTGSVLSLILGLAAALTTAAEVSVFAHIVLGYMLPHTPIWLICAVIVLLAAPAALRGIETSARASELLFLAAVIPLLILLILVVFSAPFDRILPLTLPPLGSIRESAVFFPPIFQGFFLLLFVFPYLERPVFPKKHIFKVCLSGATVLSLLTLLSSAAYGSSLSGRLLPTLQVLERVSLSGVFLSRQDILLLWFWMAPVFLFTAVMLTAIGGVSARIFSPSEKSSRPWLLLWIVLIFVISCLPRSMAEVYYLRLKILPPVFFIFLIVIPIILIIVSSVKDRKGGASHE